MYLCYLRVQGFVCSTLGHKFTEPPLFDLAGSYKESSNTAPLLFVLSTGSDPTAALLTFAQVRNDNAVFCDVVASMVSMNCLLHALPIAWSPTCTR